ncbi:hypothetical protein DUNSADRAFT_12869 [Dunaliella salina]|uniref:MYND-type domain-containing protein n=1 Tax=Dunaliella salina TaxID=3046 RepID=A0ABQ7H9S9_DUNSA|nr:hypothetical protein DUNSADRAFT_12869 [Dunaliella salina]|eukprot:KAF5843607.1 hypothetical protein DUNSADRAFT_12869 [Dunaliella salina]
MEFRSLPGRPRFFTPGHARDLTHYPQASRRAAARYMCRNPAISIFEKYMAWTTAGFASAAKTWSDDQMDAFDWTAAGLQFINHAAVEAKGREADELKRLLPRGFLASCAVKMLDALAAPFIPVSTKGNVTKGTWHGVELSAVPADGGTGRRTEPIFVRSRAGEAVQILNNLLPCGPHSEAAAVVKSSGKRVQKMVLKVCEGLEGYVPLAAFGLEPSADASGMAGSCVPVRSSSKGAEHVCLACGRVRKNLKRCSGCNEVFLCDAACQRAAWPSHKAACRQVAAAKLSFV